MSASVQLAEQVLPLAQIQPAPPARPALQLVTGQRPERVDELAGDVAAAIVGDERAVERLLGRIRPLVIRYCRSRLGRTEHSCNTADDVAQEVCVAVYRALPNYRNLGRPFLSFVYGIAAHKVADARRSAARDRSEPTADAPDGVSTTAGPEQLLLRGEASEQMRALMDKLTEKQRQILVLRIVQGLSADETADVLDSTPGAVRVAQHRALTRLRRIMA